jgi:broad specificity phosphatase PhoE
MRLLLIRHGQTPANVAGILETSRPGPGLTELGVAQARAVPDALAGERIDAIYASVLVRTQLTAAPLAERLGLEVRVREGFHEVEAGSLEGRRDREAVRLYLETVFAWGQGELDRAMPGGPDGTAFFARFDDGIAQIVAEHDDDATVVLVDHGAAIRVWCGGRTLNVDPDFSARHELANTGIVVVTGEPGAWTVESWMGDPVGGERLDDETAADPTGEPFRAGF